MIRRLSLAILVCGLAIAGSGCCGMRGLACGGPLGACGGCGSCGEVACGGCVDDCGVGCGDCCEQSCDTGCYPCGPLSLIMKMVNHNTWCGCGCGERYWGDWCGDPPDCCEPCDRCGNWTGPGQTVQVGHSGEATTELVAAPNASQDVRAAQTTGRNYNKNRR